MIDKIVIGEYLGFYYSVSVHTKKGLIYYTHYKNKPTQLEVREDFKINKKSFKLA